MQLSFNSLKTSNKPWIEYNGTILAGEKKKKLIFIIIFCLNNFAYFDRIEKNLKSWKCYILLTINKSNVFSIFLRNSHSFAYSKLFSREKHLLCGLRDLLTQKSTWFVHFWLNIHGLGHWLQFFFFFSFLSLKTNNNQIWSRCKPNILRKI